MKNAKSIKMLTGKKFATKWIWNWIFYCFIFEFLLLAVSFIISFKNPNALLNGTVTLIVTFASLMLIGVYYLFATKSTYRKYTFDMQEIGQVYKKIVLLTIASIIILVIGFLLNIPNKTQIEQTKSEIKEMTAYVMKDASEAEITLYELSLKKVCETYNVTFDPNNIEKTGNELCKTLDKDFFLAVLFPWVYGLISQIILYIFAIPLGKYLIDKYYVQPE